MRWNKNLLMILAGIVLSLNPRAAYADENHRVLMIVMKNDGTNEHDFFVPHLISVTTNKVENIATLKGNVMFGSDDKTTALLGGGHLMVLDRKKLMVIADVVLTNTYPVVPVTSPDENLAVDSKQGKVYIPVFLKDPYSHAVHFKGSDKMGFLEVDWKKSAKRIIPIPFDCDRVISLPNAIGAEDGGSVTIYDEADYKPLLHFADATPDRFYPFETGRSDYYYVPDLGLFESRASSSQFQLTDRNLSTNDINPLQIVITNSPFSTAFDYDGEFFIRNINGKPHWIWLENDGGTNGSATSKIVMADMESGKATLREPLDKKAYSRFMPNADASNVYFFDAAAGQIYSFDRNSKTTSLFFKLPFITWSGGWTFVDAD